MKLTFTATANQSADRLLIQAKESKWYKKEKYISYLFLTIIIAIMIYLSGDYIPAFSLSYLIPTIIITYICGSYISDKSLYKNFRKDFIKDIGKENVEASFELTDQKIIFKFLDRKVTAYWRDLIHHKKHKRFLELKFKNQMTALIHDEIFIDKETRNTWLTEIQTISNQTLTNGST